MSWALIAHGAIPTASGIMAASRDICEVIANGDMDTLFIFLDDEHAPGMYLWEGNYKDDEWVGRHRRCDPEEEWEWIAKNLGPV